MFDELKDTIIRNKYLMYLNTIGVETEEIIEGIQASIEKNGYILENIFSNRSYKMLSPNILLEDIIFSEVSKHLHTNYKDTVIFEEYIKIDMKTLIATQNSIIERPNTKRPSETDIGFKTNLEYENGFVRIAKFENEMIEDPHGFGRKGHSILFEGLSIFGEENPFAQFLPSFLIWKNSFYYRENFIIGFTKNFNSIESDNILWLHQSIIDALELKLDDFNNGLKALNDSNEVILEFRQWRTDLVGHGSNIAKVEGCDLILREDYFLKFKEFFGDIQFFSYKIQ
ncbi:MAG: hypothetical protein COA44_09010 [Arcobacter sp.]|nr:MAG: hypothetical protein COA44_09010 [Arcobacter sp.]